MLELVPILSIIVKFFIKNNLCYLVDAFIYAPLYII